MPEISKTNLSPADVLRITEASLGREAADSEPLTAGQCNALYAVTLSDGSRCVLKIAPDPALRLRRGERWLMQTETAAMWLAQTLPGVPLPRILAEDRTCALCPAPFFIMEYAPGHSAALDRPHWSAEEHDRWYRRFGEMIRAIAEARAPSFGIVASGRTFSTLSAFAGDMLEMVLADCRDFGVDTGADADEILARFGRETAFGCVTEPRLVHYDFWENNVMLEGERISSLLDWERAVWGDPLMEDRFRSYALCPALLEGYGGPGFTLDEAARRRCLWYDLTMAACLMADVFVRQYAEDSQYRWARRMFVETWEKLR